MTDRQQQQELPFAEAEGTRADRRNLLGLALLRAGPDLYLSKFCDWIFNITAGGTAGELTKSYRELAAGPWGLCCSRNKARLVVARARSLGLVTVTESRYVSFGQRANDYAIDWDGVRRLLRMQAAPQLDPHPPPRQPGALTEHPHALTEHPHALTEHPFQRNNCSFKDLQETPDPEPEPRPVPKCFCKDLLAKIPELVEASRRSIEPLPAGGLKYGIFEPLTLKQLRGTGSMVGWFRGQLSAPRPATGPTEAELLLVLAAALYALEFPTERLTGKRVGLFVGLVSKHRWQRVLPKLREARRRLDELIEHYGRPALLEDEGWPVPDRQPSTHAEAERSLREITETERADGRATVAAARAAIHKIEQKPRAPEQSE